jgi:hypothetical protein
MTSGAAVSKTFTGTGGPIESFVVSATGTAVPVVVNGTVTSQASGTTAYYASNSGSNAVAVLPPLTGLSGTANSQNIGYFPTGSVAYGNGYYVVSSSSGNYYTTNPSGTWTAMSGGVSSMTIGYGNGIFMAVYSSGAIYTCTSPASGWSSVGSVNSLASSGWYYIRPFYANGVWLLGNFSSTTVNYARSTNNGVTWTSGGSVGGAGRTTVFCWNGTQFILAQYDNNTAYMDTYYSTNGSTWTASNSYTGTTFGASSMTGVLYSNGTYLFVQASGGNTLSATFASNQFTFTGTNSIAVGADAGISSSGYFVSAYTNGTYGCFCYSANGSTWTQITAQSPANTNNNMGVAIGPSYWLACTYSGGYMTNYVMPSGCVPTNFSLSLGPTTVY